MPLCGVYQIPPRFVFCLPRQYAFVSVPSRTATVSTDGPSVRNSVSSTVNAVPPVYINLCLS